MVVEISNDRGLGRLLRTQIIVLAAVFALVSSSAVSVMAATANATVTQVDPELISFADQMLGKTCAHGKARCPERGFRPTRGKLAPPTEDGKLETVAAGSMNSEQHPNIDIAILFDLNSSALLGTSKEKLKSIAGIIAAPELADADILVEGHTDASGEKQHNKILSVQRAETVRDYLVKLGIDAHRLYCEGRGQDDPAEPNDPFAPVNRRVVFANLSLTSQ